MQCAWTDHCEDGQPLYSLGRTSYYPWPLQGLRYNYKVNFTAFGFVVKIFAFLPCTFSQGVPALCMNGHEVECTALAGGTQNRVTVNQSAGRRSKGVQGVVQNKRLVCCLYVFLDTGVVPEMHTPGWHQNTLHRSEATLQAEKDIRNVKNCCFTTRDKKGTGNNKHEWYASIFIFTAKGLIKLTLQHLKDTEILVLCRLALLPHKVRDLVGLESGV